MVEVTIKDEEPDSENDLQQEFTADNDLSVKDSSQEKIVERDSMEVQQDLEFNQDDFSN